MSKRKNISVVLLILTVTATVMLVPLGINAFNSNSLTEKTEYWEYDTVNANTITSQQVAELYYTNQLNSGTYSNISTDNENSEFNNIKNDVSSLLESFFENEELYVKLQNFADAEIYSCTKQSILTVANSAPVALNLISFSCWYDGGNIEIVYEEKTLTLISIYCESTVLSADDSATITNQISYYYKNLGLNENQYFCNSDTQNISCFILNSSESVAEQN